MTAHIVLVWDRANTGSVATWSRGTLLPVTDVDRAEVVDQLRRVIAWELESQLSIGRTAEELPLLIADTVFDYFDVTLRRESDVSGLE